MRKILILSLILMTSIAMAQTEESRLDLTSISLNFGSAVNSNNFESSLANFRKLAPNSVLLKQDLESLESSNFYDDYYFGASFNANLHFSIKNKNGEKPKYHPQLRFGISYINQEYLSYNLFNSDVITVDTLTSNRNGNTIIVDSVSSTTYNMEYGSDQLLFDLAYIIGSNPENRLRVYGGLSLSLGMTFNARTRIELIEENYLSSGRSFALSNGLEDNFRTIEESYSNDLSFSSMLSIPFGLEFRLSKKENAWGNSRLFIEGRPGISYLDIPELDSRIITTSIWGFGFKYDF